MKSKVFPLLKVKSLLSVVGRCAFAMILIVSCKPAETTTYFTPENTHFSTEGRTDSLQDGTIGLIGPASAVRMNIKGDSVEINLSSNNAYDYVTLVADDEHLGRFKIDSTADCTIPIKFTESNGNWHTLSVYKATEANAGTVLFNGVYGDSIRSFKKDGTKKRIEFIGNSITCGAAMDNSLHPCGTNDYKNYHNAYLSYGPTVARALNADFMLSSVSGFGMYRGWNTAPNEEINTVPEVYSNLYLDGDGAKEIDFTSFEPHLVSICLGTNDLSNGDGEKMRKAFDANTFVDAYIAFIDTLHTYYPDAQIALLTSPMVSGVENDLLTNCLIKIQAHFGEAPEKLKISIFSYATTYQNGCTTHPNIEDHEKMAAELYPFYKDLLAD